MYTTHLCTLMQLQTHVRISVEQPWGSLPFEVDLKWEAASLVRLHCHLDDFSQQQLCIGLGHLCGVGYKDPSIWSEPL